MSDKHLSEKIILDEPIKQGDNEIKEFTLRRPGTGELRGLTLNDVLNANVDALVKLTPRVSNPVLTENDVAKLCPADIAQLAAGIAGFFMTKAERASLTG